jgi:hypothetical protein
MRKSKKCKITLEIDGKVFVNETGIHEFEDILECLNKNEACRGITAQTELRHCYSEIMIHPLIADYWESKGVKLQEDYRWFRKLRKIKKCECGAEKVRTTHSNWCPVNEL